MIFNYDAAATARANNPLLTVFDTGELMEPFLHQGAETNTRAKTGKVDFDDELGTTIAIVSVYPSATEDATVVINIEASLNQRVAIVFNGGLVGHIETDANLTPAVSDGSQHFIDTGMPKAEERQLQPR
jgi:hypothetical protein